MSEPQRPESAPAPGTDPAQRPAPIRHAGLIMIAALVLPVVAVVLLLGHPHKLNSRPGSAPTRPPAGYALLSGAVQACGGPSPGSCRVTQVSFCAPTCLSTSYVRITAPGGRSEIARLHQGRFTAALRPGAYTLELVATGSHGASSVLARRRVALTRNATRRLSFRLGIP